MRTLRAIPRSPEPAEPASPERLLTAHEVQARFPTGPTGEPLVSLRWVQEHVCPRKWTRLGRRAVLRESLFDGWYGRYIAGKLTDDDKPTRERDTERGAGHAA